MKSSKSLQKRTAKSYFEEISSFDLFYQLTFMSATAASGISRARVFQLARQLSIPPARYFKSIHEVAENLRYNYPDAVRLVGEHAEDENTKSFLLRLSDALRSGEPLSGFLAREAEVQGENYSNDYLRRIESMKKWTDAYSSVAVSVALIVIINMVMTMIYNVGPIVMISMVMISVLSNLAVAWVLFRASPQETKNVSLKKGSKEQRQSRKLLLIVMPAMLVLSLGLMIIGIDKSLILIVDGLLMLPAGFVSVSFDKKSDDKDTEISSFLRSLGGTATSRGTTIKDALANMKKDSFPFLQSDIHMLDLRLKSFGEPRLCWKMFGCDTGSKLADQSIGIFYEAVNLGGDPERAGNLTSAFALKTAMLRAQRRGVSATFTWLTLIMHAILTGLMVFLLGILGQFATKLNEAMAGLNQEGGSTAALGLGSMFSFNTGQVDFLATVTIGMVIILAFVNAFAIVASEGTHLIKISYYLAILLIASGVCFIVVPPFAKLIM